jgi:LysM repeat protein
MRDGTVESPTIKFMEDQSDADGNKVLGAFNKDTNEILIDKGLFDKAQAGDKAAAATLLGVMAEEQGHAVASVLEQRMGIQDFRFDEGGLAARSILQDFASSGSDVKFDLNIGGSVGSFATSADAINNAINTQFSSARLLSDRQMGGREFSSSNNSNQYKVQAGDTFWDLAKADLGGNASEAEIQARTQQYLAANEGVDPLGLQVGQGVIIPGLVGLGAGLTPNQHIFDDAKVRREVYLPELEKIPERNKTLSSDTIEQKYEKADRARIERNGVLDETRSKLSPQGLEFSKDLKEQGPQSVEELVEKRRNHPDPVKREKYRAMTFEQHLDGIVESSGRSNKSVTIQVKVAGYAEVPLKGVAVIGAGLDGYSLGTEINESLETGEWDNTTEEASRIGGAWTGAWAFAEAGAAGGAFFGPIGALVGGVGGGVLGYVLGGIAGENIHEAVNQ